MRPRPLPVSLAALLLPAFAGQARAAEIAPEHGKVNTGDATPVGAGVLEVELGYALSWALRHGWGGFYDSAPAHEHGFGLSLTWGAAEALDLGFATEYALVHDECELEATDGHGYGDSAVAARWRFLSAPSIELTVTSGATLPTGADGAPRRLAVSQGYYAWDSTLVASWDAGRATGNLEVGYSLALGSERANAQGVMVGNVALGYHLLEWLQPELEFNHAHELAVGADASRLAVTGGVVIPWGDGHRVTAGLQQAIWGEGTAAFTGASLAYKAAF